MVNQHFVGTGTGTSGRAGHEPYGCFQTTGSLWIDYDLDAEPTRYRRMLDLGTAIPLSLAALGVYRIVKRQGAVLPTGATLLWWAYSGMRRGGTAARRGDR